MPLARPGAELVTYSQLDATAHRIHALTADVTEVEEKIEPPPSLGNFDEALLAAQLRQMPRAGPAHGPPGAARRPNAHTPWLPISERAIAKGLEEHVDAGVDFLLSRLLDAEVESDSLAGVRATAELLVVQTLQEVIIKLGPLATPMRALGVLQEALSAARLALERSNAPAQYIEVVESALPLAGSHQRPLAAAILRKL